MTGPVKKVVTIDGPAGAGKSTLARKLSERLGWTYLDTGAMYRAVGLTVLETGGDVDDEAFLEKIMDTLGLEVSPGKGATRVFVKEREITGLIRTPEVGSMASRASAHGVVRRKMVDLQRAIGEKGAIVAEGRDMGTVVFPDAAVKFFLVASIEERARRRWRELEEIGTNADFTAVREDMARRDENDSTRALAPLKPAPDAIRIDSTAIGVDEVLEKMLGIVLRKFPEMEKIHENPKING